ncbi:MAG: phycobiliprotein lyase [Coleofasciculaceae cyanobacterium]
MDITQFVERSIGRWRSQRSAHHLAFSHFEAIQSVIDIVALSPEEPAVIELCKSYDVSLKEIVSPFRMAWEGESDWDEEEVLKGSCVLIPVPDPVALNRGKLLRDQGYAETMAAVGDYYITEDNTFVLVTKYDRAAAEEKIWFVNPDVRCRVSLIKTSGGTGVLTASFSSEIRSLSDN